MNQTFLEQLTEFIFVEDLPELSPACRGGGRSLPQRICPLYPAFRAVQHFDRAFRRRSGKGLDVSRRL